MGINRWTQDLTAYLESVVLTKPTKDGAELAIQNVVIDGPSMVYHVYNSINTKEHMSTVRLTVPSYTQLNKSVEVFLTDLESCGIKM